MGNIELLSYEEMYVEKSNRLKIIYGIGSYGNVLLEYLSSVDMFCDKKAETIRTFHGKDVILPQRLELLNQSIDIFVCVKNNDVRKEIIDALLKMNINGRIIDPFNNKSFDYFVRNNNCICPRKRELKYVRIINRDRGWILEKFAHKMQEELEKMGIRSEISDTPDYEADMNYYTIYEAVDFLKDDDINISFMITHINCLNSINKIKHILEKAQMGICMSRETLDMLVSNGVPREKICYINPAQDGIIKPRKYVLGITHNCHDDIDHRKRASAILDITKNINPALFELKIMGSGWDEIVNVLQNRGFDVTYYSEFDKAVYNRLMPSLDYYLYWGFDEGNMGYLDALAAGVKTIVTPQGYHLDTKCGLTYPCRTIHDFENVLLELEKEKMEITNAVADWTWDNFARKHVEVWNYMLGQEKEYYNNQHKYEDGIFSVLPIEIGY